MKTSLRTILAIILLPMLLAAADWPSIGFHSNSQPDEKQLSKTTVGEMVIVWRKHLGGTLSSPVILGRVITHHGIEELVFVNSSDDAVTAIDGDLGSILWQRKMEGRTTEATQPVTPAFRFTGKTDDDDDDDDDGPAVKQPLYVLSSRGNLFALRTISGMDEDAPVKFQGTRPIGLRVEGETVVPIEQRENEATDGLSSYRYKDGSLSAESGTRKLWSRRLDALSAPIIGNSLLFILAQDESRNALLVLDASTGDELKAIAFDGAVSPHAALALANGHVAFTTASGDVYCMGLPIDI